MLFVAGTACAAEDSAWDGDARSAARLIAGTTLRESSASVLRGGIEIRLGAGWKTYWRYPGDSGVPPRFDFAGSDNVGNVTVLWPAPHRFTDDSGTSIGYKNNVVFPLRVTPRDSSKPVTLALKLDYAVCEKLCVPAEASAKLSWNGAATAHDAAIAGAEATVPKTATKNAAGSFGIAAVHRTTAAGKALVTVDAIAPPDAELFAEGPTAAWALPVPTPEQGAPAGHRHFSFELDGLPAGVDPKAPVDLKLTLVSGQQAIEVTTHLD